MLEQYSSDTKKQRTVTMEMEHSVPKETKHSQREPPRPRNRFATLLQWRNQSEEGDGKQEGTRSRYTMPRALKVMMMMMTEFWERVCLYKNS